MGTRCILYLGDSEDDNSAVRKVSVYVGIKFRQETYPAARLLIFNRNQQSNLSSWILSKRWTRIFGNVSIDIIIKQIKDDSRSDRTIFLTSELRYQLSSWLNYNYRVRRVCFSNNSGKTISEYRTPERNGIDLIFSVYQSSKNPNPDNLYVEVFCENPRSNGQG